MASDIEAIFYICGAIIWGLANYPVQTLIILALFYWFFIKSESAEAYPDTRRYYPRKPLDLNRKLAPSYIRAYDRLIGYIQARGGAIKSREDGRQRLSEIWGVPESDVGRFFDSPYVIKTLGLEESQTSDEAGTIGDDWWEKGYDSDEQSRTKPETVQKIERKISSISEPTGDSCGHPGCTTEVSAFDFRCYTCRNRFCSEHAGSSIDCNGCAN